jgi:hypothetical protein
MRFGITVLIDAKGDQFIYPGQGEVVLPLAGLPEHKAIVKEAAAKGLVIGGKVFSSGIVVSQYGTEASKKFPVIEAKKSKK